MRSGHPDLRMFIDACRRAGELQEVSGAAPDGEIGAITEINARRATPRAMLFGDIPGYPPGYRVLSGIASSPRRMGIALGIEVETTRELLERLHGGAMRRWVAAAADHAPVERDLQDTDLRLAACEENGINVLSFPAPLWHPLDGGRYIGTACAVLTRDRETGWVNAGSYRLMVLGEDRLSLWTATSRHGRAHLQSYWDRGEPCPIVAVLGGHPLLTLLAGVEIPEGVSELNVAGSALGAPIPVIRGTATGLPVPAGTELAFEGWAYPGDTGTEGPFGEGTGYYAGGRHEVPVIRVEHIYLREDPILLGAPPGKPPHDFEYPFSVLRSALLRDAIEAAGVQDIRGVWSSYARQWVVVSVRQRHPGQSRQAAYVAAHCGPGAYMARYIVAVDEDIDPTNAQEVLWAIVTRANPEADIEIVRRGWGSPIDPLADLMEEGRAYNSRAVIDACIPFTKKDVFPAVAASDPEALARVAEKWRHVLGGDGRS